MGQEINVGLVHSGKILHVGKVNIILDYLLQGGAGKLENFLKVLQNGSLGRYERSADV